MATEFQRGRRLAFDIGTARIGVAVSDPDGILASPVSTIQRISLDAVEASFRQLLDEYQPVEILVGLPKNLRNEDTKSTVDALEVASLFETFCEIPILMVDERMSTVAAQGALRAAGRNVKSSRAIIDQQAACVILETGLQQLRTGKPAGTPLHDISN